MKKKFAILITTKDRKEELFFTLSQIETQIESEEVECLVYDDGSADGTSEVVKAKFPWVKLIRNDGSKGLMYCRNLMLNRVNSDFAISLDDDAHFLSESVFGKIEEYFTQNPKCGVIAARIFWGKEEPMSFGTKQIPQRVQGFVGCGHVWNMKAWRDIPDYPEWFVFYGEEEFAAYQLFKKEWEVHYVPEILVHHRVDVRARKYDKDYQLRTRRSFRSGWYLYFLFYPYLQIPYKLIYTLWVQIKNKALKGDCKATIGIMQALGDVLIHLPKLLKFRNGFSRQELRNYNEIEETKIYWKPDEE